MKIFAALTAIGFAILAFAAVWLGGLNQDEGWYLYAAQLVSDGHVPYRDFFYTQGPVLPLVYSAFAWVWRAGGLLGARVLTLAIGAAGILFAAALAQRLVSGRARAAAALLVCVLLGGNLYHLYYLAIPKTYALAGLFAVVGFYLLSFRRGAFAFLAGLSLAFAAGTRISLGALLPVAGVALLLAKERRIDWLWFGLGGGLGLTLVYGPFLLDPGARAGLLAAQGYHAARGGFDPVFTVGSLSRLVRWYAPVFVLFGLALACGRGRCPRRDVWPVLIGFLAVFAVQMAAPFPYEDYQVPVMSLLTVAAVAFLLNAPGATAAKRRLTVLLALGMTWAGSFGSPLLEKWMTNGQDRFWTVKKTSCEMAQLRAVAEEIDAIDPGGKTLLTQDLYLAIETRRSVPLPLAMGPFSYWGERPPAGAAARTVLDTAGMRALLASAPSPVAAMSGYAFAVTAPDCRRTPLDRQMAFWKILEQKYELVFREEAFGQNATPLLVLKRRQADGGRGDNAK
jgi:hypothetical protein